MWWADWANDNALSLCSLAAQGLWMRLLCLAAQNEPYGSILIGGRQASEAELAKLIKPSLDLRRFQRLLAELERRNVIKRDADGTLFSSRMRADYAESTRQSTRGNKSWKARQTKTIDDIRFRPGGNIYPIRSEPEERSRRKKKNPPNPPRPSRAKGKGDGWAEFGAEMAAKGSDE